MPGYSLSTSPTKRKYEFEGHRYTVYVMHDGRDMHEPFIRVAINPHLRGNSFIRRIEEHVKWWAREATGEFTSVSANCLQATLTGNCTIDVTPINPRIWEHEDR